MDPPPFKNKPYEEDSGEEDSDDIKPAKRSGRRKIKIEYIEDKNRRHITFSKRKAGIMKKAYELSTLTGTQVLLLVVSETGLVYTFTTVKLQPIVTKPEGKSLIQACLNAPDPNTLEQESQHGTAEASSPRSDSVDERNEQQLPPLPPSASTSSSSAPYNSYNGNNNISNNSAPTYSSNYTAGQAPSISGTGYSHPYNDYQQQPSYHHQQQQQQQQSGGNSNQAPYGMNYYDQQQQYMPPPNHQDYWVKQEDARHNK